MNNTLIFIILTSLILSSSGGKILNKCIPSTEHKSNYEPKNFPRSNNLLRNPGEAPLVCGEKLLIRGKLLDKDCVPVSDAKIYIWHVACDGKYPYQPLRNIYDKDDINLKTSATFTGAGTAITNNKGEFYFITTYPASFHGKKPYIDVRVTHKTLDEFNGRFYTSKMSSETPPVEFMTPFYKEDGVLTNELLIVLPEKQELKEF